MGTFKDGVIIPDAPLHCENGTRLYIGHLQKEEDYPYWFRDPVHGFIRVSAKEKKIIDHPYFQRLRRIKQLGMTHYVYHGAEHNRFGHSLGVMELATRAIDLLWEKHASLLQWMPLERRYIRQLVRLAALLHDLGHPPFSHVAESLLPEKNQLPGGKPNEVKTAKHEDYTRAILLHSELKDYIEKLFADIQLRAEDVWALIKGTVVKYPFLLRETAHHPSKGELEFIQAKKKFLESKGIRELYLDDGAEGVLTKLKPLRYTGEEERKIYVIGEHGEKVPLQERSKVIEKINEEIKLWRLYCHEDDILKADQILKEELEAGN